MRPSISSKGIRGSSHNNVPKGQLFVYIVQILGPCSSGVIVFQSLILLNGRQLRAARALLGWTQEELSGKAKVAVGTVKRMEGFNGPVEARTDTLRRIVAVFEKAGLQFLNDGSPGVRLRAQKR